MNKFVFLMIVILITSSGFASEVFDYFFCGNDQDAYTCSDSCKKKGSIRFILTDETATNLLMQLTTPEDGIKSTLLNNCKIVDKQNWYCSELYSDLKSLSSDGYKIFQMIEGKYSQQYNYYSRQNDINSQNIKNMWVETFGCAK